MHVLDKNDNAPHLIDNDYEGHVLEDMPVGSFVMANASNNPLVIYATDADTQANGLLRFDIMEPIAANMFYIDGFTGIQYMTDKVKVILLLRNYYYYTQ